MSKELGGNDPDGPTAGAPDQVAPIFLLAADVKLKAREAFLRGELPSVGKLYSAQCAIGLAMSRQQIDRLKATRLSVYGKRIIADDVRIRILADREIVATDNLDFLSQLQWANDLNDRERMGRLLDIEAPQVASEAGVAPSSTPSPDRSSL